jgi:signal transduction histidine kinase/DNA-binding NarL/FixJ family response regulator
LHAVLSLLLVASLLLLLFRKHPPVMHRAFVPLASGVITLLVFEVLPRCMVLRVEGFTSVPSYFGWALLGLSVSASALMMREPSSTTERSYSPNLHFAVPLASTGMVGFFLVNTFLAPEVWSGHIRTLLVATFAALLLLVLRQTIMARDNLRLAQAMSEAKEAAESANAARLHFLANISHDLRTPLNGILGSVQILLREVSITPKQRDLLRTVQGSAEHLRNLITDLLDLSKLEADRLELSPSAFDLGGFLDELVKSFAPDVEKKQIRLELAPTGDLPRWIECDRKRLQQILGNLVHNAIKFTDRGTVRLRAQRHDPDLVFEVADTGCGILPDKLPELFQPFHVVGDNSIKLEGTGLGLSISRKLARRMGGDITVQSIVAKGSTFTVRIPLHESKPVVEVRRTVVDYQGRRRRILIVDDQPANRLVLRNMLEPLDFLVDEAEDADAAIKALQFSKPDVVLLDLMMPGVDGFELLEQIKAMKILREPPCIAISAMFGDEVEARCRQAGFQQLINKPVNLDILTDALHQHAGIEWTYGIIQAAPAADGRAQPPLPFKPPPPAELAAFLDLARRGFVRNLQSRADQLAHAHPDMAPFATRVSSYVRDFKVKELADWLANLATKADHGSS